MKYEVSEVHKYYMHIQLLPCIIQNPICDLSLECRLGLSTCDLVCFSWLTWFISSWANSQNRTKNYSKASRYMATSYISLADTIRHWDARFLGKGETCVAQNSRGFRYIDLCISNFLDPIQKHVCIVLVRAAWRHVSWGLTVHGFWLCAKQFDVHLVPA